VRELEIGDALAEAELERLASRSVEQREQVRVRQREQRSAHFVVAPRAACS
jgi:hypothetical protein